jgi:hypothetical protein
MSAALIILVLAILAGLILVNAPSLAGVPWIPTPIEKVRKMLSLAELKPGETVYDLGSGDGRIIITAAKEFQARSVGIELAPLLVLWTQLRIRAYRLGGQAHVVWGDFFRRDLSESDVVTLFLWPRINIKLKQKLEAELRPGARVVSYAFPIEGWIPWKIDEEEELYLYKVQD